MLREKRRSRGKWGPVNGNRRLGRKDLACQPPLTQGPHFTVAQFCPLGMKMNAPKHEVRLALAFIHSWTVKFLFHFLSLLLYDQTHHIIKRIKELIRVWSIQKEERKLRNLCTENEIRNVSSRPHVKGIVWTRKWAWTFLSFSVDSAART